MLDACCYSEQEQQLLDRFDGKENPHRVTHRRLFEILETFDGMAPIVDIERARLFTESMRETEGEPLVARWAKALEHIARNITVYVDNKQLIVGRCGTDKGRYGILYPELDGDFIAQTLTTLSDNVSAPIMVDAEDAKIARDVISPYWVGKTFHENLNKALPPESHRLAYHDAKGYQTRFIVSETASYRSTQQWVLDYGKVLTKGFAGIKAEAQAKLDALDPMSAVDFVDKKPFLEAVIRLADAIVLWARRHAVLAREKAESETEPWRRQELLRIAEHCERVPEHPARTFHEAVQSQWFTQCFSRLEQRTGTIISNGRMDQYLYPFYIEDMRQGQLSDAQVLEIFDCLWLNMAQFTDISLSPGGQATQEGYAHWEAVTVGGQTREGVDATNELTYLLLESRRVSPMPYPDLAVRIHARSPERLLWDVAETVKVGQGYPKLFNDEEIIPLHLAKGAPLPDILDYTASGCAEIRMPNRDTMTSAGCQVNMGAALEMTLRNGRMKKYGRELIGCETGEACDFATWEDFLSAYEQQQNHLIKFAFINQLIIHRLRARHFAGPLTSALHDLCMQACKDIHTSDPIPGGIDLAFYDMIGFATVTDSLAVIKKLVFEDRSLSMKTLLVALDANFEGMEVLRQRLAHVSCFGNNDPYVDAIGCYLDRSAQSFTRQYAQQTGLHIDLRTVSVTANVPHGKEVGALPNGRRDWMPLSDGSSPAQGADTKGPVASLLSNHNTKNWDFSERAARLLNVKFSPKCLEGDEGSRRLVAFMRTFCDLRLWHIQFNVINKATMQAAQLDPEKYRSLIVRIAGYSAYFTELSRDLQNDLIARTANETV